MRFVDAIAPALLTLGFVGLVSWGLGSDGLFGLLIGFGLVHAHHRLKYGFWMQD